MLTASQIQDTNIVEAKLDGEIQTKEIEALRSEIDSVLAEHGKLRLLFVYEGIGGADPMAIWKDLKLEVRLVSDIEKMAVVSEKGWFGSLAGLLNSITSMEIETFEVDQREDAVRWLKA